MCSSFPDLMDTCPFPVNHKQMELAVFALHHSGREIFHPNTPPRRVDEHVSGCLPSDSVDTSSHRCILMASRSMQNSAQEGWSLGGAFAHRQLKLFTRHPEGFRTVDGDDQPVFERVFLLVDSV